jgi:hypothetical protein
MVVDREKPVLIGKTEDVLLMPWLRGNEGCARHHGRRPLVVTRT